MVEQDLVKNAYYRNIKNGKKYKLLGVAKHSENPEEELVMYQQMYDDFRFWVRPLDLFLVKFEPWEEKQSPFLNFAGTWKGDDLQECIEGERAMTEWEKELLSENGRLMDEVAELKQKLYGRKRMILTSSVVQRLLKENDRLIHTIDQIDTHIRSTSDPLPHIIQTLKELWEE